MGQSTYAHVVSVNFTGKIRNGSTPTISVNDWKLMDECNGDDDSRVGVVVYARRENHPSSSNGTKLQNSLADKITVAFWCQRKKKYHFVLEWLEGRFKRWGYATTNRKRSMPTNKPNMANGREEWTNLIAKLEKIGCSIDAKIR